MKKIIFICAIALGILSCSSDQANVKDVEELSVLKIENVQRINSDEELQKIAYRLLNENEKFIFWKDRFDLLLQEDEFTTNQKQLISEMQNKITVSLFTDIVNDDQEYFKNIYIPHFLERAQTEFTFEEIDGIFYSARPFHVLTQAPSDDDGGGGGGSAKDCNCNQGSLFGCGASQNCGSRTCEGSSTGCGFLWLWECNGNCNLL